MADGLKLTCGLDAEDNLVELGQIDPHTHNGKACGLVCPACRTPLIARLRGTKMKPHLAHAADANCNAMTVLHALAERILQMSGITLQLHPVTHQQTANGVRYEFDVTEETTGPAEFIPTSAIKGIILPTGQQPDVFLTNADGRPLAIEVLVTHAKSEEDIARYSENGIDMLEIDLSDARTDMPFRELRRQVLSAAPRTMHIDVDLPERLEQARQRAEALSKDKQNRFIRWVDGIAARLCNGDLEVHWTKVYLNLFSRTSPVRIPLDRMPEIPWSTLIFAPNRALTHWVATFETEHYERPVVVALEPDRFLPRKEPPADIQPDVVIRFDKYLGQNRPEGSWTNIADGYVEDFAKRHGLYLNDLYIQFRRRRPGRLITLCRKAKVSVPKELGAELPHWGYPLALWQAALLAHIKEKIRPGDEVRPEALASPGVLNSLLLEPVPDTQEAFFERMADIKVWLSELQRRNGLGQRRETDIAHEIFRAGKYSVRNPFLLTMQATQSSG
jgi:hypothetical protein